MTHRVDFITWWAYKSWGRNRCSVTMFDVLWMHQKTDEMRHHTRLHSKCCMLNSVLSFKVSVFNIGTWKQNASGLKLFIGMCFRRQKHPDMKKTLQGVVYCDCVTVIWNQILWNSMSWSFQDAWWEVFFACWWSFQASHSQTRQNLEMLIQFTFIKRLVSHASKAHGIDILDKTSSCITSCMCGFQENCSQEHTGNCIRALKSKRANSQMYVAVPPLQIYIQVASRKRCATQRPWSLTGFWTLKP